MKKKRPIIDVRKVWKTYKMGDVKVHALKGIDIKIMPGEFVAIKGPSGSGKSTCMNMVGCLDVPTKGEIFLDGKDISHLTESELAQIRGKKIGFIFQKFNLINTLTALENVALPMIFQGIDEGVRIKKAKELLQLVELGERMHHKPLEL
ncbi:MAG: ABC transporter ATP-binding protein, partial [Minisyncoccales bacterium]